ncbi:GNAT family N-acetyltransferase [Thalassotalea agarivorans]|uniref:Acetyltransferase (GNAT) domain-containing protein n=1 Tax=Thalassotalea agarivorans TaxID=349064 RepID=A0A1I0DVL6_THASX|nr:GNAT family N-acetyltransferase [Thalassotalea agarivorans]SET36677.1 Acetyltransferase (GNAT) domain-containing protein [Thalassotalea agarivorans]
MNFTKRVELALSELDANELTIKKLDDITNMGYVFELYASFTGEQRSSIFNSSHWLRAWFSTFWQSAWQLQVYVFYDKGNVVAIAPFYLQSQNRFPYTKSLFLLGQGEQTNMSVASEYLDILIAPFYKEQVLKALCKLVSQSPYDILYAQNALSSSNVVALIAQLNGHVRTLHYTRYQTDCSNWSIDKLSKNQRARYKKSAKQLAEIEAKIFWVTPAQFKTYWHALRALHQQRWQAKGQPGAFCEASFSQFHQAFYEHAPENVAMSAIVIKNDIVAVHYYLRSHDTLHFYQSGWDQSRYAQYSLGTFLHSWSILHADEKHYDFMMGSVRNSYKETWANHTETMVTMRHFNTLWKSAFSKYWQIIKSPFNRSSTE